MSFLYNNKVNFPLFVLVFCLISINCSYLQSKDCSNCTKKHKTNQDRKDGETRSFVQTFK